MFNNKLFQETVVFGGAFNPPGTHHLEVARVLARRFKKVIVFPSGTAGRNDKNLTEHVSDEHRARMCRLNFGPRESLGITLDLSDIESGEFTPTCEFPEKFKSEGRIWIGLGSDNIAGGAKGESVIQRKWRNGQELWKTGCFAIVNRGSFSLMDLPPHHILLGGNYIGASKDLRVQIAQGNLSGLEEPVADYIRTHKLYGYREGVVA